MICVSVCPRVCVHDARTRARVKDAKTIYTHILMNCNVFSPACVLLVLLPVLLRARHSRRNCAYTGKVCGQTWFWYQIELMLWNRRFFSVMLIYVRGQAAGDEKGELLFSINMQWMCSDCHIKVYVNVMYVRSFGLPFIRQKCVR